MRLASWPCSKLFVFVLELRNVRTDKELSFVLGAPLEVAHSQRCFREAAGCTPEPERVSFSLTTKTQALETLVSLS